LSSGRRIFRFRPSPSSARARLPSAVAVRFQINVRGVRVVFGEAAVETGRPVNGAIENRVLKNEPKRIGAASGGCNVGPRDYDVMLFGHTPLCLAGRPCTPTRTRSRPFVRVPVPDTTSPVLPVRAHPSGNGVRAYGTITLSGGFSFLKTFSTGTRCPATDGRRGFAGRVIPHANTDVKFNIIR